MELTFRTDVESVKKIAAADICATVLDCLHADAATTEIGLLASTEHVEACLFGNGERTGNVNFISDHLTSKVENSTAVSHFCGKLRRKDMVFEVLATAAVPSTRSSTPSGTGA